MMMVQLQLGSVRTQAGQWWCLNLALKTVRLDSSSSSMFKDKLAAAAAAAAVMQQQLLLLQGLQLFLQGL
jgi:hypothetical protein